MEDIKRINNLTEYIELLKDFPPSDFVFRGENCYRNNRGEILRHEERLSSAFHKHKQTRPNSGYYPDFMKPIHDFHSEVGHNITADERKEFLAFSQHYGLRTNLLDITKNPLVALYFACSGSCDEGSIYIYNNSYFIDITKIIQESPMENVIDMIASGNERAVRELQSVIKDYFKKHTNRIMSGSSKINHGENTPVYRKDIGKPCFVADGVNYIEHMMFSLFCHARDKFIENGGSTHKVSGITYDELIKTYENEFVTGGDLAGRGVSGHEHFESLLDELCNKSRFIKEFFSLGRDNSAYYVSFLHYCWSCDYGHNDDDHGELEPYMDFLPSMVYKPSTLFERARLQRGYFIYQPYMRLDSIPDKVLLPLPSVLDRQGIEIQVSGTNEIIGELDNVNVNLGTLFGDHDNIARYIKNKYGG